ncbi:MAG: hypothetical protein K5769_04710 [Pseudobutyrivibrio sp.]|nr:hypothetical protein [Pseudobutyrivibrio sp.]
MSENRSKNVNDVRKIDKRIKDIKNNIDVLKKNIEDYKSCQKRVDEEITIASYKGIYMGKIEEKINNCKNDINSCKNVINNIANIKIYFLKNGNLTNYQMEYIKAVENIPTLHYIENGVKKEIDKSIEVYNKYIVPIEEHITNYKNIIEDNNIRIASWKNVNANEKVKKLIDNNNFANYIITADNELINQILLNQEYDAKRFETIKRENKFILTSKVLDVNIINCNEVINLLKNERQNYINDSTLFPSYEKEIQTYSEELSESYKMKKFLMSNRIVKESQLDNILNKINYRNEALNERFKKLEENVGVENCGYSGNFRKYRDAMNYDGFEGSYSQNINTPKNSVENPNNLKMKQ